ncbi:MAG: ABC transporter substrate-binding protein [Chloroflexota bacterium]
MKKLRWQILIVILTLVVVGILLIKQQPTSIVILPQPASGGIYTEGMVGKFGRLNPLFDLNNLADRDIDKLIFSGLISFDPEGIPQPDLAESWGVSLDGTIYNVTIRPQAIWHDGEPITSADVLFTLSLLRSEITAFPEDVRSMWNQVTVTSLDEKTLRFELPEPFAPFMDYLNFEILPKHILEAVPLDQLITADFNLHPIGSGPYQFDSLMTEAGEIIGVVLKVFPDYYGQIPYIEQIAFKYYPNSQSALEAYQQGEVTGINRITLEILESALAEPNLAIYSSRLPELSMVFFNLKNPDIVFLQDKEIRTALMLGLNRQWIIDHIFNGQAIIAHSPILPGNWAYYDSVEKHDFDLAGAVSILDNLGYKPATDGSGILEKDGISLSFTLLYPNDSEHVSIAEVIQSNWQNLGIKVELQAVSYNELINDYLVPRNFQAALVDLDFSNTKDPDPYPFWHQAEATGGQNYSQWDNRSASEYIEQARVIVDTPFRIKLYRNFQILFSRELPALPLYYPVFTFGVDTQVSGIQISYLSAISDRFYSIKDWYLVTRRTLENVQTGTEQP